MRADFITGDEAAPAAPLVTDFRTAIMAAP
jgi:hypothetical protein